MIDTRRKSPQNGLVPVATNFDLSNTEYSSTPQKIEAISSFE